MGRQIAIVTPVLDDWESFTRLVAEISSSFTGSGVDFHLFALDDGSTTPFDVNTIRLATDSCVVGIEVLHLAANLGHQRAIAVGLCAIADRAEIDAVIIMDSDGEDRPADIAALLAASHRNPSQIVFARRARRSESWRFRLFYRCYKFAFRILTGRTITFGNFSLLPLAAVRRLVHMPELWNHLAATIMRSRLPYTDVPTTRGKRYAGRSSMNVVALAIHGLSAMSVYTDVIFVRVLMAAGFVACLSLTGIIGVALVRFATDLAIPGWATIAGGDLMIVLSQTGIVMVATSLMMLAGRSNRPIVPIIDSGVFIASRETWRLGQSQQVRSKSPRAKAKR